MTEAATDRFGGAPPQGSVEPAAAARHADLWRRLVRAAALNPWHVALVVVVSVLAAFSEFLTIALIQPVLMLFSGNGASDLELTRLQLWVVAALEVLGTGERIMAIICLIIVLQILRESLLFLSEFFAIRVRTRFELAMRKRTYRHCLAMHMAAYRSTEAGEIHTILNAYPRSSAGYVFSTLSMIPVSIMLAVYVAMMVQAEWRLFLIIAVVSLLILYGMKVAYALQGRYGRMMRDGLVRTSSKANELVQALPVIRAFAQERRAESDFVTVAEDFMKVNAKSSILNAAVGPLQRILSFTLVLVSILVFYSVSEVEETQLIATIVLFMFILARVNGPLTQLNLQRLGLAQLRPFVVDLLAFLDRDTESDAGAAAPPVTGIAFERVGFAYEDGTEVLRDIDLHIEKGEFVGLAGPSGAGKTTLANLLLRFELPTRGRIAADGQDIAAFRVGAWRGRIGMVPQKPYMFDASIMENIRFARPDASDTEVREAARLANANDFIEALPDGYATRAGEGGSMLSGGQAQRLALARALLIKPELLILDEATSAQDTESERRIKETLEQLRGQIAVVVIAHRLSTIVNADKIVVLDQGRVAESGRHRELIARGGLYARLVEIGRREDSVDVRSMASCDDVEVLSACPAPQ